MEQRLKNIEVETYHYEPQKATAANGNNILRVAAYARVSTLSEDQGESFETQCAYYEKLISSNPKMTLVGVYGDQGVSGLSTKGRTEFARMMQDCRDGKIDFVITRSVSRLSRNMAECVETVNFLKDLGIPVRFEKEGLTTTDPGSEMFFHVLATLAQEESGSISRRITWALERRAKIGDPARKCPYGYRKPTDEEKAENEDCRAWVFDESESKRVKKAFEMAADIYPYDAILQQLDCIEDAEGTNVRWTHERLYHMLRSEVYRGDVLTHKTYGVDYVTRKRAVNRGERTQYYVHDHHEPMVPVEMYERVQSLMDAGLLHSAAYKMRDNHEKKAIRWRYEEAERMAAKVAKERREKEKKKNIVQVDAVQG